MRVLAKVCLAFAICAGAFCQTPAIAPGGVLNGASFDKTPGAPVDGDPVREFLLRDPRLAAVELLTTPQAAAIVAVRLR